MKVFLDRNKKLIRVFMEKDVAEIPLIYAPFVVQNTCVPQELREKIGEITKKNLR